MTDDIELELIHDDKFGEMLRVEIIEFYPNKPIIIAKLRQRGVDYLAIHKGYVKGNELHYGKGIRLSMEEDEAELVSLAMQSMLLEGELLEDL